jgi:hypothetical protein
MLCDVAGLVDEAAGVHRVPQHHAASGASVRSRTLHLQVSPAAVTSLALSSRTSSACSSHLGTTMATALDQFSCNL